MAGRKATTAHDYNALFEMLLQGRVDIVLATEASARSILYRMGDRAQKSVNFNPLSLLPLFIIIFMLKTKALYPYWKRRHYN